MTWLMIILAACVFVIAFTLAIHTIGPVLNWFEKDSRRLF